MVLQKALNYFIFSIFRLVSTLCFFMFIKSKILVASFVDVKMISTTNRKQQNKRLDSLLREGDIAFTFGEIYHDVQDENIVSVTHR